MGIVSSRSVYDDKFPGQYILAPFVDAAFTGEPSSGKAELYYDGMFREPRVRVVPGVSGPAGTPTPKKRSTSRRRSTSAALSPGRAPACSMTLR